MNRLLCAATAPWRLAKAARRQGMGPVISFIALTVRRRGALDAIRLAFADRQARQIDSDSPYQTQAAVAPEAGPPDLDGAFGLSDEIWGFWRSKIGSSPPHSDPLEDRFEPLSVSYIVISDGADAEKLADTCTAIRQLGFAEAQVVSIDPSRDANEIGPLSEFVVFLHAGDQPWASLPRELGRVAKGGIVDIITFDLIGYDKGAVFPLLLPGANPTLLRSTDYFFGRAAIRHSVVASAHPMIQSRPRDLILRWMEGRTTSNIRGRWRHVSCPLVDLTFPKENLLEQRRNVLLAGRRKLAQRGSPGASVVICTRNKGHLTRQLVRSLLSLPPEVVSEVTIVSNQTTNPYALGTLEDLSTESRVQVLRADEPFNFSRLSNTGARASRGEGALLFLNDDIAPVSADWLERLLARLDDADVGAAGPLLLYPDESVQHAGMYLGYKQSAGHTLRGARLPEGDYLLTACAPREVSCLTGAVLLVRRRAFEALNGFDEQLGTYLQDVDLCLRLRRCGWVNVFEPSSILVHMESASIKALDRLASFHRQRQAEYARFQERWGDALIIDPFHAQGFDPEDEGLRRLSGARGVRPPAPLIRRAKSQGGVDSLQAGSSTQSRQRSA